MKSPAAVFPSQPHPFCHFLQRQCTPRTSSVSRRIRNSRISSGSRERITGIFKDSIKIFRSKLFSADKDIPKLLKHRISSVIALCSSQISQPRPHNFRHLLSHRTYRLPEYFVTKEKVPETQGLKICAADGGTWTHTWLPTTDFESASSAIPTHRLTIILLLNKKYISTFFRQMQAFFKQLPCNITCYYLQLFAVISQRHYKILLDKHTNSMLTSIHTDSMFKEVIEAWHATSIQKKPSIWF